MVHIKKKKKNEAWVLPRSSLEQTVLTSLNLLPHLYSGNVITQVDHLIRLFRGSNELMKTLYK